MTPGRRLAYLVLTEIYGDEKLKRSFYEDRYSPIYDDNNNIIKYMSTLIDNLNNFLDENNDNNQEQLNNIIFFYNFK